RIRGRHQPRRARDRTRKPDGVRPKTPARRPTGFARRRCTRPEFLVRLPHDREADLIATPHRLAGITPAIRSGHTRPALTPAQSWPSWPGCCDWSKTTAPARLDPGERDHDTIVGRPRAVDVTDRPIDGTGTTRPGGHPRPGPTVRLRARRSFPSKLAW